MTKHKQSKARRRAKQIQKEARMQRESSRRKTVKRPKPMSKESLLAQRVPINEEQIKEGTENGL